MVETPLWKTFNYDMGDPMIQEKKDHNTRTNCSEVRSKNRA